MKVRRQLVIIAALIVICSHSLARAAAEPEVKGETQAETEVFRPSYSLHGEAEFEADSYFGNYPVINEDNWMQWGFPENELEKIKQQFPLSDPTVPNTVQQITVDFYANPAPDFEFFTRYKYKANGVGAESAWEQLYAQWYSDRAMYTLGRFEQKYGALDLILKGTFDALMLTTTWNNSLISAFYSRRHREVLEEVRFPYVTSSNLDELGFCRWVKTYGKNQVGLNLLLDGFDNEKGLSLDYKGKLWNRSVKAELALSYPCDAGRDLTVFIYNGKKQNEDGSEYDSFTAATFEVVEKGVYPGLAVAVNLLEAPQQLLTLTLGGLHKGFRPFYGVGTKTELRDEALEMEDPVKLIANMWGGDLLYQRRFGKAWTMGVNLALSDYIDQKMYNRLQKNSLSQIPPFPTRRLGIKLKKQLTVRSEISGTLTYFGDDSFDYGKIALSWKTVF